MITEPTDELCEGCGSAGNTFRIHLFTKEASTVSPVTCGFCCGQEKKFDVELREPEVKVNRGKALRRQKKVSQEQEIEIAEELGARVQKNSGAVSGAKGDVRKKGVARIEAKYTTMNSYGLHLEDLQKIEGECAHGEKPVFVIDYQEPRTYRLKGRYAVIPFEDLKEFLNAPDNHR